MEQEIELEAKKKEEFLIKYRELSEQYGYALDIALTVVKLKPVEVKFTNATK